MIRPYSPTDRGPVPCHWCNYANAAAAGFCGGCGRSLASATTCPSCGAGNPEGHRFCDACGGSLTHPASSEPAHAATSAQSMQEQAPALKLDLSARGLMSWAFQHRWELLIVLALTGFAAFLRLYRLTDFPPGLHGDEAWAGIEARRILADGWIGPWSPTALGQPAGIFYWTVPFIQLLPDTVFTLRLATAVLAILVIPATYLFARAFFDSRVALVAGLLIATSFWHLHYSRIAFSLLSLVLVESVCLALLWIGIRRRHLGLLVLSGAFFGLGVYTYKGFPLLAGLVLILWVHYAWSARRSGRRLVMQGVAFAVPALIVMLPFLVFFKDHSEEVLAYRTSITLFNTPEYLQAKANGLGEQSRFLAENLRRGLFIYFVGGDVDFSDGLGARAALDPVVSGLFAIGLVLSLARIRQRRHLAILAAVALGVAAVGLSVPNWGEARKGIAAMPFVFTAAAVAFVWLLNLARAALRRVGRARWRKPMARWAHYAAGGAVLVWVAWFNLSYYFNDLATAESTRWVFLDNLVPALEYVGTLPQDGLYVYFYAPRWSYNYETRRYLLPDLPGEDRSREFGRYSLEKEPAHGSVVYVLMPPYHDDAAELMRRYPNGTYHEGREGNRLLFATYYVGDRR